MDVYGGGERVAANLCNDLSKDFEMILITYNNAASVYAINKNVKIVNLCNDNECSRLDIHASIIRLRKYLKYNNIDILLIIGRSSYPIVPLIAGMGLKTRIVFCDQSTLNYKKFITCGLFVKLYRYITQMIINNLADHIVVLTEKEKRNYLEQYNITENKITSIYNYLDMDAVKIKKFDIEKKKIITVARIDYAKGMELLIEVAANVLNKHPDWQWDVYGDGDKAYTRKIIALRDSRGLENRLNFKGKCSNIYSKYSDYDIFVFTSRFEGFGLTLLEAMASGLPAVSFDIYSGPSEIISNGVNGFLVEAYDILTMSDKICTLIENRKVLSSFAYSSRINMYKFEKNNLMIQWKKLLRQINDL